MKHFFIILLCAIAFEFFSCIIWDQLNNPTDPCSWGVIPYDTMRISGYWQSVSVSSRSSNDTTKELLVFWPDNRYYRKTQSTNYYLEEYGYFSRDPGYKYGLKFRLRNKFSFFLDTIGLFGSTVDSQGVSHYGRRDSIRCDTVAYAKSDTAGLPSYSEWFYREDSKDQGMTKFYTQDCGEPGCACPYPICTFVRVDSFSVLDSMWERIQKTF